tara:strand:- start:928 stop:1047 length:120 start_codon:yes stop_codon:yes gene_type:complete
MEEYRSLGKATSSTANESTSDANRQDEMQGKEPKRFKNL